MKKDVIKDWGLMFAGAFLIGIGAALSITASLGSDPLTTLEQGVSIITKIDFAWAPTIVNMVWISILLLVDKKRVSLATVACPFVISMGVKVLTSIIPASDVLVIRWVYYFLALVIIGLGIAVGAKSATGSNPYDAIVLFLNEKTNVDYGLLRSIGDAICLVFGILLKGTWGLGTVISILLQGKVAGMIMKILK